MMQAIESGLPELGRLEDLPPAYRGSLESNNLVPLWPNLRSFLPPNMPLARTRPARWAYSELRPLLMEAGRLTPMEKAERRVLALANPGHGRERMKVTASIYLGMQLLLPGELAPSHRHTPNAARLIVEGERAYTEVNGVRHFMSPGDLILTPTGMWHEHGHHGSAPVVWLDILDLPLVYELEAAYVEEGRGHAQAAKSQSTYFKSGVVPSPGFERNQQAYPIVRYPWAEVRDALHCMAAADTGAEPLQVTYVNPETGADCLAAIGFHAVMIRPAETRILPIRSCAAVFHVIEGAAEIQVNEVPMPMSRADTCCAPGFAHVRLRNVDRGSPCFLFVADESPLQRKLGLYEVRSGSGRFSK